MNANNRHSKQGSQQDEAADNKNPEAPFLASLLELDALWAMLGMMRKANEPRPDDPEAPIK